MKQIKIPLFLKILVYLMFFLIFLSLVILPANFISIFSLYYFLSLVLTILGFILFFYILKGNRLSIKLFSLFIFLNFGLSNFVLIISNKETLIINIFYSIFLFFVFFTLYLANKRIKKGIENLDLKYITEKKQHNIFLFTFLIYTILLLIFRFGYYNIEKSIENYEDFFVSKYQNIDIKEEDNLFYDFKKLSEIKYYEYLRDEKIEISNCIYYGNCNRTLSEYKQSIEKIRKSDQKIGTFFFNKLSFIRENNISLEDYEKEVEKDNRSSRIFLRKNIDILYIFDKNFDYEIINDLGKKKYFKTDFNHIFAFTSYIQLSRDLKYKTLYYININEEEKAIKLLESNINASYTILNGDASLIESLVGYTTLKLGYETIDFILDNLKISSDSKYKLINLLNNEIKKEFLDNGLIIDHLFALGDIENFNNELNSIGLNSSLYFYEYTKKGFEEIRYDIIKNNGISSDYISKKYGKLNFFKKNIIGQILWPSAISDFSTQYNRLFELEEYRLYLLEKINK